MINNAPNPSESYISPCVIENVTVKTEFGESTVNVQAQMLISPNAYINLGEFIIQNWKWQFFIPTKTPLIES